MPHTVTRGALIKRINRKLAHESDNRLRVSRSARMRQDVGDVYIIDRWNAVVGYDIDVENMAREIGVLSEITTTPGK